MKTTKKMVREEKKEPKISFHYAEHGVTIEAENKAEADELLKKYLKK